MALECLSVLKASVSWLSRTLVKGVEQETVQNDGKKNFTPAAQLKGPGHGSHAARACIASTVPSVIDCFSRIGLRGPAEDVLHACAGARVSANRVALIFSPRKPTLASIHGVQQSVDCILKGYSSGILYTWRRFPDVLLSKGRLC